MLGNGFSKVGKNDGIWGKKAFRMIINFSVGHQLVNRPRLQDLG